MIVKLRTVCDVEKWNRLCEKSLRSGQNDSDGRSRVNSSFFQVSGQFVRLRNLQFENLNLRVFSTLGFSRSFEFCTFLETLNNRSLPGLLRYHGFKGIVTLFLVGCEAVGSLLNQRNAGEESACTESPNKMFGSRTAETAPRTEHREW